MRSRSVIAVALFVALFVVLFVACDSATDPPGVEADGGQGSGASAGSDAAPVRACPVTPSSDPLVIAIDKGLVRGKHAGTGYAFLGIPFAKPPTGERRFMPPEAPDCWSDVVDATHFGDVCAQINMSTLGLLGSEDCLSVNVWTPALPSASSAPLPVLFWIFGGGDIIGGSDFAPTYGQALANARNAVVVSFNYRVGALGFLAHPALTAATLQHTSGNNGLLDAVLALHWVQDNIAYFGGDKTRVMVFGESAGAINTCALVASPLAHGLFSSALMESGNCAAEPLPYRYARGEAVAVAAGCALAPNVLTCLQNAPVGSIVQTSGVTAVGSVLSQILTTNFIGAHIEDLPFGPTIDGYVLDATPIATIRAGAHNHVPLVVGANDEEFAAFIPATLIPAIPIASCAEYAALVTAIFPANALSILQTYRCNIFDPGAGYREFVAVLTDAFFTCPSRRLLRTAAAAQAEPVYRYVFTHGVGYHGVEVAYVFDTFATVPFAPTPAEAELSRAIQSYWVNLAASGNPNGAGLPSWGAYSPGADNALVLETPIATAGGFGAVGCSFWDRVQ